MDISKLAETLESVLARWPELRTRQMLPACTSRRDADGFAHADWDGAFEYVPEDDGDAAFELLTDDEEAILIAELLSAAPDLLALLKQYEELITEDWRPSETRPNDFASRLFGGR